MAPYRRRLTGSLGLGNRPGNSCARVPSNMLDKRRRGSGADLAYEIRRARIQRNVTLAELAARTGHDKGYLSRVERGLKTPSIATVVNVAAALDIPVSQLFGESLDDDAVHVSRASDRAADPEATHWIQAVTTGDQHNGIEGFLFAPPEEFLDDLWAEHRGQELLFVVSGQIEVRFVDRTIKAAAGDALQFSGRLYHQLRRLTPDALALVAISRGE